jgi:hypothetical protein
MTRLLKVVLKIVAGTALLVILLFFGVIWYITYNKNKVLKLVNTELNSGLDGTITIGDMRPNFFQQFPHISLGLQRVLVIDKRFAEHHHTLLDAKDLSISVNAWALLRGKLAINHITISNASVDIFTDSLGYSNLSVFKKKEKNKPGGASKNNYNSNLGVFTLTNVAFKVEDQKANKKFDFIANAVNGRSTESDSGWSAAFHLDVTARSMAFDTRHGSFIKNKTVEGDLTGGYNEDSGRMWVKSESLDIGDDPFQVNAVFETLKKPASFTFNVASKEILWRNASALLAANIKEKLDRFNIVRPIAVKAVISGSFRGKDPFLYVTAGVTDNTVITPGGTFDHTSFEGIFTNEYEKGKVRNDDNSVIRLVNMKGSYRNMPFEIDTGSIINLNKPIATGNFRADFPLTRINEILGDKVARFVRGTIRMDLRYKADIVNYRLNKPVVAGSIILTKAELRYIPDNLRLKNSSITLYIVGNDLLMKNLRLQSGRSVVNMEGRVNNFMNLYYNAPERILLSWDIHSPQLYLGEFIGFLTGGINDTTKKATRKANSGNAIDQLSNVLEKGRSEMHLTVDNLHYSKFLATDVHADLLTSEDKVLIKNVGLKHAGGFLKLSGSIIKGEQTNQLSVKTTVSHVDVHEFFDAFNNFGLKDFTAENLSGYLSAKTQITAEISDQATLLPGSINGTLDVNLQNGALINFKPLGSVAKFAFPFRDLKNIRLSELNARFDVHGDQFTIYPFKLSSSVLNMDVAGVYGIKNGTDITLDVPLRNPKNDTTIHNEEKLMKKRYRGIVLHIRAKSDSAGKIKIGWNKDRK